VIETPTIHASAVLVGARALLIRGPAGSGKSRLAWALLQTGDTNTLPFSRLIADDRVHLMAMNGRLLVRPAASLAGMIEMRGLGIRRVPFEAVAVVGMVVDLSVSEGERLPIAPSSQAVIDGIALPRLAIPSEVDPWPMVLAMVGTHALPA